MSEAQELADAARTKISEGIDYLITKDGYAVDDVVNYVESLCDEYEELS